MRWQGIRVSGFWGFRVLEFLLNPTPQTLNLKPYPKPYTPNH